MNIIKETREKLGLTQHQLADYLLQSRSYIAMSEIDKKNLPTGSLLKVVKLIELLKTTPDFETAYRADIQQTPWMDTGKILEAYAKKLNQERKKYETRLKKMQGKFLYYSHIDHVIAQLLEDLPEGIEGERDKAWLLLYQRNVHKEKLSVSRVKQAFIRLKIDTLRYEKNRTLQLAKLSAAEAGKEMTVKAET